MSNIEAPIRLVSTDYNHQYLEIPTGGWPLARRWEWVKAIITGKDIVYRPRILQHIDLTAQPEYNLEDSRYETK